MTHAFAHDLLAALERTGPRPALAWYGEAARIELSGHVLANWVIKSIGHLHDEIDLAPGAPVALDLPPHWKRLVLALAVWSMGGELTSAEESRATAFIPHDPAVLPEVLITDRPGEGPVQDADDVLALDAVSLAPCFAGELPALAHDWVQEVRASSDRLGVALPPWSGPEPGSAADADVVLNGQPGAGQGADATPVRLLVDQDGLEVVPLVLTALLGGGGIVGPATALTKAQIVDEQVTTRP